RWTAITLHRVKTYRVDRRKSIPGGCAPYSIDVESLAAITETRCVRLARHPQCRRESWNNRIETNGATKSRAVLVIRLTNWSISVSNSRFLGTLTKQLMRFKTRSN